MPSQPQGGGQSVGGGDSPSRPRGPASEGESPFASLWHLLLSLFSPIGWFGGAKTHRTKPTGKSRPGKRTVHGETSISSRAELVGVRSYESIMIGDVRDGDVVTVRACIEARPDLGVSRQILRWPGYDLFDPAPPVKMEVGLHARVAGGILVDVEDVGGGEQLCTEPDAYNFPEALLPGLVSGGKEAKWIRLWHGPPMKPAPTEDGEAVMAFWSNIKRVGNLQPEVQLRIANGNLVLRIGLAPWVVSGREGEKGVNPSVAGLVVQLEPLNHTVAWSATIDGGG